jgi:sarcosine oxidase, subunit beta
VERTDVLIVGGGLTGCATAWHLARAGAAVTVVERRDLNAGASGQNAGSLHFQIERRFLEHGEELAKQASRVVVLNKLAVEEWRCWLELLGGGPEIVMDGGLMIAETAEEMRSLEQKAAREAEYGLGTKLLDAGETLAIAPYLSRSVLGATWLADEGHANPRNLTLVLARAAAAAGAVFRLGASVTAIQRSGSDFSVAVEADGRTSTIHATQILVAAGVWTARVGASANLHLPIFPAGLTMNITERTAPFMRHLIQHVGKRLSMKQAHDGNVLIGGGYSSRLERRPDGEFDLSRPPALVPDNVRENLRVAARAVPAIADLNLIRSWTGTVALTPDQLPLVGEVPRLPGFHVCAGGSGFTLAPVFARFLADSLGGGPSELAASFQDFSPARFNHLNGFMG